MLIFPMTNRASF